MRLSLDSKHPGPYELASRRPTRLAAYLLGAVLVAGTLLPTSVRADDQDVIDYRQHIMQTMGQQLTVINLILQHKVSFDSLATFTQALAVAATTAKSAFMPAVQGGGSKPDVWKHWADFSKRLDDLVTNSADLAKAAQDGGATAAASKLAALGCKSCHDIYMQAKQGPADSGAG